MSGRGRKPMLSESMAAAPWRGGGTMARRPGAAPRRRHQSGGTVACAAPHIVRFGSKMFKKCTCFDF